MNIGKSLQLVYNAVTCRDCGETLVSYHRHDYKTCSCPNEAMVDGGLDYGRYGAVDMQHIDVVHLYADDDFEVVRKYAYRGGRGKDGKQPLTYIPICDMDDDYLQAVVDYGGADWHIDLIKKEIQYRSEIPKFIRRLKKIGIEIKLIGNFPWIYLDSVNGNKIKPEDYSDNHGYTIAWSGVKLGEEPRLDNDLERTFYIIRKYKS